MAKPKNRRALCSFIGMINYYRDMWKRQSALLALLTALTSDKVPWTWSKQHQKAFDAVKKIISHKKLLSCPNFNKPFGIRTDASDLQLDTVISQNGKPIAFTAEN